MFTQIRHDWRCMKMMMQFGLPPNGPGQSSQLQEEQDEEDDDDLYLKIYFVVCICTHYSCYYYVYYILLNILESLYLYPSFNFYKIKISTLNVAGYILKYLQIKLFLKNLYGICKGFSKDFATDSLRICNDFATNLEWNGYQTLKQQYNGFAMDSVVNSLQSCNEFVIKFVTEFVTNLKKNCCKDAANLQWTYN